MSYELLSEPIRRYIRDKGWEALRPIQAAAITRILGTEENYILASRTASGKTEAAFLPVLSKMDVARPGVQVLYISPLIALINDQFQRVEELCKYLDVPVTKWHGEASRSAKEKLAKDPSGIVLITPESLEAMLVNKPYLVKTLFSHIQFVVIDEVHSFIGSDRGIQLKSILSRLQDGNNTPFRVVALSATIGDYEEAKKFTGNEGHTKVLLDRTAKEMATVFRYFKTDGDELPLSLLKNLYLETKDNKVLLFPNSRGRAEEIAVKLKKISDRVGGHPNYFSHHSSVDKEVREYVEHFAKNNRSQNFLISCTSTLELGIDIGTVDEVVQVDATHSIASLIQRVGRSGRREGEKSYLFLYATNPWSLLQSLACYTLFLDGFIEPPVITAKPYDILLHQALSITKQHSGIFYGELILRLQNNFAFKGIEHAEIKAIVDHLIKIDFLEQIQNELIIGLEGEKLVNNRDFYSVFKTEENFKVINAGNNIGEVPFSVQIKEGENILLSARVWKIVYVDMAAKKIEVQRAHDGKKPQFFGSGAIVHQRIREQMLQIVYSTAQYEFLEESATAELMELRHDFQACNLQNLQWERPVIVSEEYSQLYTFTGTRTNRSIAYILDQSGFKNVLDEHCSLIELKCSKTQFMELWPTLSKVIEDIDFHLEQLITTNPMVMDFSKWGIYLPLTFKLKLLKERYFDFPSAEKFITNVQFIFNKSER